MSYKIIARYGSMGFLGNFTADVPGLRRGDKVVLRTERGIEAGNVVTVFDNDNSADPGKVTPGKVARGEIARGEVGSGEVAPGEVGSGGLTDGEVIRPLSPDDEREIRRINDEAIPSEMTRCRDHIKLLMLPMKVVDAEHLLGGEKIIFYFVADGRVDFRQLVKDIAREYKTRIELRQIGVRDEARLLSELGHCGQCLCCKTFMKSLEPVTMRMAKSQKATLDPTKISGVCGRLMCCLRYEDKVYSELKTKLPKRGVMVSTKRVSGKVVDTDVLAQIVSIRTSDSNLIRVPASEIVSVEGRSGEVRSGEVRPSQSPDDGDAPVQSAPPAPAAAQSAPQGGTPPGRSDRRGPSDNRGQRGERRPGGQGAQGSQPSQPGRGAPSGQPGQPGQPGQSGQPGQPGQPQSGQPGRPGQNDRRSRHHRRRRSDNQPPRPS